MRILPQPRVERQQADERLLLPRVDAGPLAAVHPPLAVRWIQHGDGSRLSRARKGAPGFALGGLRPPHVAGRLPGDAVRALQRQRPVAPLLPSPRAVALHHVVPLRRAGGTDAFHELRLVVQVRLLVDEDHLLPGQRLQRDGVGFATFEGVGHAVLHGDGPGLHHLAREGSHLQRAFQPAGDARSIYREKRRRRLLGSDAAWPCARAQWAAHGETVGAQAHGLTLDKMKDEIQLQHPRFRDQRPRPPRLRRQVSDETHLPRAAAGHVGSELRRQQNAVVTAHR
ncbi:MAG: hypothetical protein BWY76_03252 [bacterium ADurb.Bin429]|nr:MAG: hypothetical protein BWY76_03252 [bacterium ADurb.Bin429]